MNSLYEELLSYAIGEEVKKRLEILKLIRRAK